MALKDNSPRSRPIVKGDKGYVYTEKMEGIEAEFVQMQGKALLVRLLEDTPRLKKGSTMTLLPGEFCVDVLQE